MASEGESIIADAANTAVTRPLARIVAVAAGALGAAAAIRYHALGLTLSHYDARAHLVVARRVFDSLTPGWRQLGGMWLPLPHLLNLLPVAWDMNYRSGASAVVISIVSLSLGLAALSAFLYRRTGSIAAAVTAPALILANPNVLYLQSTPMTEPLLLGLSLASLAAVDRWISAPSPRTTRVAGWLLAALVLTRYEGWFVTIGLLTVAAIATWPARTRDRGAWMTLLRHPIVPLKLYPVGAVAAFLVLSWASTGQLLVTSGFYVADNPSRHLPIAAFHEVVSATTALGGLPLAMAGAFGLAACLFRWWSSRSVAATLPFALLLTALLPLSAFDAGHPYRVRYMVPVVAALSVFAAFAIALAPRRLRWLAAIALIVVTGWLRPPLDTRAPMVIEAQREAPTQRGRRAVTAYLNASYNGTPILACMDSLGHYMQETSAIGLNIKNFVHEGNGDLWLDALAAPRRHVEWILIETLAEGGDQLAQLSWRDPQFLSGFNEVAEGGGAVLYRRAHR